MGKKMEVQLVNAAIIISTINNQFNTQRNIMLLYESNENRNNIFIDYINEGLKNGCFCIYASVDIDNSKNMLLIDSLSSRKIIMKRIFRTRIQNLSILDLTMNLRSKEI